MKDERGRQGQARTDWTSTTIAHYQMEKNSEYKGPTSTVTEAIRVPDCCSRAYTYQRAPVRARPHRSSRTSPRLWLLISLSLEELTACDGELLKGNGVLAVTVDMAHFCSPTCALEECVIHHRGARETIICILCPRSRFYRNSVRDSEPGASAEPEPRRKEVQGLFMCSSTKSDASCLPSTARALRCSGRPMAGPLIKRARGHIRSDPLVTLDRS